MWEPIDAYCERLSPAFWAEPVNAVTNAAFLLAALVVWGRTRGDAGARALAVVLALIGVGSFLFHTVAVRWSALADVLPILAFILLYLFLATRRFFGAPLWAGLLAVLAFVPVSAGTAWASRAAFGSLNGSEGYLGTLLLILAYGAALLPRDAATGGRLLAGGVILALSLTARSLDAALCEAVPIGTHFLWHLLNGLLLGWMIHAMVAAGARVAPGGARR